MMTITAAARAAGLKVSTLRFYERQGLVPAAARTDAGYRQYSGEEVRRLRFIRRAQELGFSLEEVGRFLHLSARGLPAPNELTQLGIEAKLGELDQRIEDLQRVRVALASVLAGAVDERLGCPIIGALADCPLTDPVGR